MSRKTTSIALFTILLAAGMGCPSSERATPAVVVPTPQMPADWGVADDLQASSQDMSALATRMGAQLLGVRNTAFTVGEQRVQLNTIIAATPGDAESVMRYLLTIKTEEALLRRGTTIYEFVGPDAVLPLIRRGRQHLEGQS